MIEFISSIDYSALKVLGMVLSAIIGLVMSWIAKRSVNYRKVDKRMLLSTFLFFLYLNGIPIATSTLCGIAFALLIIDGIIETVPVLLSISMSIGILTCALLWGVIFRTKRMKEMFVKAKKESKGLFWQIHLVSLVPTLWVYALVPFIALAEIQEVEFAFVNVSNILSWGFTIWWFTLIIIFVWRTSNYIFAEMRISMSDGEVIHYSCAPKMCRVHKNYIRLLKRDENGGIIYERHINEGSIVQIEYFSESEITANLNEPASCN